MRVVSFRNDSAGTDEVWSGTGVRAGLARATGIRIGELVDLELDCVHEVPGAGAWLKVPLGKLDTERMVPLDPETVALIDRIVEHRSPGRPVRNTRTGRGNGAPRSGRSVRRFR